ncbi:MULTISPECIES: leucine-rich repeat protein [unclassified Butyrivibrio]|uniref:leucine-rich repeat protein n=1 Tax=unclassified Butyrivibrio TaxID=2639466 RepID=UPI00040C876D|nr:MULTISPECIES: leucine-rich repeat protein [unclassified Butyrivibrio]
MKNSKSIISFILAVCISLCMLSVPIPARAASYPANHLNWLQNQSDYPAMRSGGCRVCSYAKILNELFGGRPSNGHWMYNGRYFDPDVLFEWAVQHGRITSLSDVTEKSPVGQTVVDFAEEVFCKKASNELIPLSGSNENKRTKIIDYCNQGYKVVLESDPHFTYVKLNNGELYAAGSGNGYKKVTDKADGYDLSYYDYMRVFKFEDLKPSVSDVRVENITESGFDVTYKFTVPKYANVKGIGVHIEFYADPNEVSYGWADSECKKVKFRVNATTLLDQDYKESNYSISGDKATVHFDLVDDFENYSHIWPQDLDGNPYGECYYNKLPKSGMISTPYIATIGIDYENQAQKENGGWYYCWGPEIEEGKFPVDLSRVLDDPKEDEETTEQESGDKPSADDATPVGEDRNPAYNPQPVESASEPLQMNQKTRYSNVEYRVSGDRELSIVDVSGKIKKYRVLSAVNIDGVTYKITGIDAKAFKGDKNLKEITIGENVEEIGAGAFSGCKNLSKIKVKSRHLRKLHKNSFAKTSKDMQVWVRYKDKLTKYKKLISRSGVSSKTKYSYKKF